MKNKAPIGIFDSGVGGTSIWKEIHELLPQENTIYLADSANAPYGNKTATEILNLCIKNTELLIDLGCKIIVVACNTATTNAISYLRDNYDIPFIGIEPAIKPAALSTITKKIGILATKGTLNSSLFHQTSSSISDDITVIEVIGEGLVALIEAGELESIQLEVLLLDYITPLINAKCDYIVLGCSHYPYLIPLLNKLLPENVTIIDSGVAVAKQTEKILNKTVSLNTSNKKPQCTFFTNKEHSILKQLLTNYKSVYIEERSF